MTPIWLGCNPCRYEVGRRGSPIIGIVIHWMASTAQQANARFQSDCTNDPGQASAHYGVLQDGTVWQWVRDVDTAYQAGYFPVNLQTIGIEHEAAPGLDLSDAGYASSHELVTGLLATYGLDPSSVVPHNSIVATQCPGTIDIARILAGPPPAEEESDLLIMSTPSHGQWLLSGHLYTIITSPGDSQAIAGQGVKVASISDAQHASILAAAQQLQVHASGSVALTGSVNLT